MSDDVHEILQSTEALSRQGSGKAFDAFRELATARLYVDSPFRRTGLGVLAGTRDISRRADQLKMSVELGAADATWAFALQGVLTTEQVREAVQRLKNPRSRLAYEFFWFWPESYPEEATDPAVEHLARGSVGSAVDHWHVSASFDHEVAVHNLAVYYHLVALDLEFTEGVDVEELGRVWHEAFKHWKRIAERDALWARVLARIVKLADAQVSEDCAQQMRNSLAETLVRINSSLVLEHADHARWALVALQANLIAIFEETPAKARRALEECAAPIGRRIETRLRSARRRVEQAPELGLQEAIAVLKQCRDDIRVVDTICGSASEFYREVSHSLVAVALDGLVAYQRATQGNRACLALLIYLFTFEASPELKRRLQNSFEVIRDNAMHGESAEPGPSPEGPPLRRKADYEKFYHVLSEDVAPGAVELDLDEQAQREYAACATEFLANLAREACDEHDDIKLAMRAFATAIELPNSEDLRGHLEEARDELLSGFKLRKEKEVRLERGELSLAITHRGLSYHEQLVTPGELLGVRHGQATSLETEGIPFQTFLIAWNTPAGEFILDERNIFNDPAENESLYHRLLEAFYYFMATPLIDRLASEVRKGDSLWLGAHTLTREGWRFAVKGRFWNSEEIVPYHRLKHGMEGGELTVSSLDDPKLLEVYRAAETWNAVVMGYVIDALAKNPG